MRRKIPRRNTIGYQNNKPCTCPHMKGSGVFYFLEKRPKILNDLLIEEGDQIIERIEICRRPITRIFQDLLNFATFGQTKKEMQRLGYDKLFHLYFIVYLENGTVYSLEKNERVNVVAGKIEGGECTVIMEYGEKTLRDFIETAENLNIQGFYQYSAFKNNCQRWIKNIMNANGITQFDSFIMQDVDTLAPSIIKSISNLATNIAGTVNYAIRGGSYD